MGKRGHTEEESLRVVREAEAVSTVIEVCRKHGISQQSFYLWKKKYAGHGLNELRERWEPKWRVPSTFPFDTINRRQAFACL